MHTLLWERFDGYDGIDRYDVLSYFLLGGGLNLISTGFFSFFARGREEHDKPRDRNWLPLS